MKKGGFMPYITNIRDRRQVTLPAAMLQKLSLSVGDKLAFQIEDKKLVAKPIKVQSIDTMKSIQQVFQKAGIIEKELQANGQNLRSKLNRELYG